MREHGQFDLQCHNQIIYLSCFGAWNAYTARKMCAEFLSLAQTICDQPWACLTDVRRWDLGTPDVWPPVQKLNLWCNDHNQTHEAVVSATRIQQLIVKRSHQPMTNVTTEHFQFPDEAENWLASAGFNCQSLEGLIQKSI